MRRIAFAPFQAVLDREAGPRPSSAPGARWRRRRLTRGRTGGRWRLSPRRRPCGRRRRGRRSCHGRLGRRARGRRARGRRGRPRWRRAPSARRRLVVPGAAAIVRPPVGPDRERDHGDPEAWAGVHDQDLLAIERDRQESPVDPPAVESEGDVAPVPAVQAPEDRDGRATLQPGDERETPVWPCAQVDGRRGEGLRCADRPRDHDLRERFHGQQHGRHEECSSQPCRPTEPGPSHGIPL